MSEIDKKIIEYQNYTKQLELIIGQKAQYMTRQEELKIALDEIKNLPNDAKTYKLLGGFMVEINKQDAQAEITKNISELTVRIEQIEKQEKRLSDKLRDMRLEIESLMVGGQQPQQTAAQKK